MTFGPGLCQQARAERAVLLTKLLIVRDEHGYSSAELPLYFEWHGKSPGPGSPLLLVHGGGSTGPIPWSPRSPHRRSLWRPTAM